MIRGDKRGHIDAQLPPIIARLNIDPSAWEAAMQDPMYAAKLPIQ